MPEDEKSEHKPASVTSSGNRVLRTTGLVNSFEGEGFPTIYSTGTVMTNKEAETAFDVAARNFITLEEVKP